MIQTCFPKLPKPQRGDICTVEFPQKAKSEHFAPRSRGQDWVAWFPQVTIKKKDNVTDVILFLGSLLPHHWVWKESNNPTSQKNMQKAFPAAPHVGVLEGMAKIDQVRGSLRKFLPGGATNLQLVLQDLHQRVYETFRVW